jgi:hypothetical protein
VESLRQINQNLDWVKAELAAGEAYSSVITTQQLENYCASEKRSREFCESRRQKVASLAHRTAKPQSSTEQEKPNQRISRLAEFRTSQTIGMSAWRV